jgi:hypothetical protein
VDETYAMVRFSHQWSYMRVVRGILHTKVLEGGRPIAVGEIRHANYLLHPVHQQEHFRSVTVVFFGFLTPRCRYILGGLPNGGRNGTN